LAQLEESPLKRCLTCLFLALCSLSPLPATAVDDPRLARAPGSPAWLGAVGKLRVPGHRREGGEERHHIERCSATLVSQPGAARAEFILTAWHCLEWYDDLSQPILFTLSANTGTGLQRTVRPLASGGDMAADWALLRLQEAVPLDGPWRALPLDGGRAGAEVGSLWMAGYSRSAPAGEGGARLTYHPGCRITRAEGAWTDTDCRADKGASGGAVVRLDSRGGAHLTGVISAGNGSDMTRFVPVAAFAASLPVSLRR